MFGHKALPWAFQFSTRSQFESTKLKLKLFGNTPVCHSNLASEARIHPGVFPRAVAELCHPGAIPDTASEDTVPVK